MLTRWVIAASIVVGLIALRMVLRRLVRAAGHTVNDDCGQCEHAGARRAERNCPNEQMGD